MSEERSHISVCICTYKRPEYLNRLLQKLALQETAGLFTQSIVVADNDAQRSAESVVAEFASTSQVPIRYCAEPCQSVPLTRNASIEHSTGDLIAFIDDDEFPTEHWLLTLFQALNKYEVAGVLGPVKPYFDAGAPRWVIKGKFYELPSYPTGSRSTGRRAEPATSSFVRRFCQPTSWLSAHNSVVVAPMRTFSAG